MDTTSPCLAAAPELRPYLQPDRLEELFARAQAGGHADGVLFLVSLRGPAQRLAAAALGPGGLFGPLVEGTPAIFSATPAAAERLLSPHGAELVADLRSGLEAGRRVFVIAAGDRLAIGQRPRRRASGIG